jgi:hypothetical protein
MNKHYFLWALAWGILNLADYTLTINATLKFGAREANMIYYLMIGSPIFLIVKVFLPLIFGILIFRYRKEILPYLVCGMAVIVYHTSTALLI